LSTAGVDERVGIGEVTADSLPKVALPGRSWWTFAMRASRLGEVGEGFDPDAKPGKVVEVCEM